MRIGVVSHLYPTKKCPTFGVFVKDELDNLSKYLEIRLFAPYPNRFWLIRDKNNAHLPYPALRPFVFAYSRFLGQKRFPYSMAASLRKAEKKGLFQNCDLIHAHNAFPDGVAALKVFGGRIPVVVTVHGSDVNMFAMKPSLQPDIVRSLNSVDRIIAVSKSLKQNLRKIGVETQVEIIPNGIDTGLFKPGGRTRACVDLGLDPQRPRILFVGNFVPVKGVKYLIRAMPSILEKYTDCELILLGAKSGTPDVYAYDAEIKNAGVGHTVRIHESVPHERLPHWMNAADVLALPSLHEGFGLVAAEALACGRPVVATRSGGPEDIVKDGQGVLVPPKNPKALSNALISVFEARGIDTPHMIAEDAIKRFSYGTVTARIIEVYKNVLNEPL